jgi:hypothetical protein
MVPEGVALFGADGAGGSVIVITQPLYQASSLTDAATSRDDDHQPERPF